MVGGHLADSADGLQVCHQFRLHQLMNLGYSQYDQGILLLGTHTHIHTVTHELYVFLCMHVRVHVHVCVYVCVSMSAGCGGDGSIWNSQPFGDKGTMGGTHTHHGALSSAWKQWRCLLSSMGLSQALGAAGATEEAVGQGNLVYRNQNRGTHQEICTFQRYV